LFITLTEIKKSVIYDGKRRRFVERKDEILLEIELNDASNRSCYGSPRVQRYDFKLDSSPRAALSVRIPSFGAR
jgi:hypothetical protein